MSIMLDTFDKLYIQTQNTTSDKASELCGEIIKALVKYRYVIYKNSLIPNKMEALINRIDRDELMILRAMNAPQQLVPIVFESILLIMFLPLRPVQYFPQCFRDIDFWHTSYRDYKRQQILNPSEFKKTLLRKSKQEFNQELLQLLEPIIEAEWYRKANVQKCIRVLGDFVEWVRNLWNYHKDKLRIVNAKKLQKWLLSQKNIEQIYENICQKKMGKQLLNRMRENIKQCVQCQKEKTFSESGGFLLGKCGHYFHLSCFFTQNIENVQCPIDQILTKQSEIIPYPYSFEEFLANQLNDQ